MNQERNREAKEERGPELTQEQLERVAGGTGYGAEGIPDGEKCPVCGRADLSSYQGTFLYICNHCRHVF